LSIAGTVKTPNALIIVHQAQLKDALAARW
jgi:hypothetical protein